MKGKWKGALIEGIVGGLVGILLLIILIVITIDKEDIGFASFVIISLGIFFIFLGLSVGILLGLRKWKFVMIVAVCFIIPPLVVRIFFSKDISIGILVGGGLSILVIFGAIVFYILGKFRGK